MRSAQSHRRRRRYRWLLPVGLLLILVVCALLLVLDALSVRTHVHQARVELNALDQGLRQGDSPTQQTAELGRFQADIRRAHDNTSGPLWSLASHVPYLGRPFGSARSLVGVARELSTNTLAPLVQATNTLAPLRTGATSGTIPVASIQQAAPTLEQASTAVAAARTRVAAISPSWLGTVSNARGQLLTELTTLHADLRVAAVASQLAPPLLGSGGARTYLVAFLNPAEIRGGGGLIGGYALLQADAGKLTVTRIGSETELPGLATPPAGLNAEWLANYQPFDAATVWQNTDISPDFPSTGAAWAAMYTKDFGTHLDGVIALDTNALATLLGFSGPVTVAGQTVTADNAVPFLETTEYTLPVTNGARKDLLGAVGQAVFTKLLGGHVSGQALFTDVAKDAVAGHVHLFSTNATEEAQLAPYPFAGVLPTTTRPFFLSTLTDAGGEKLSQYLSEKVDYTVQACDKEQRQVQITVTLHSDAPTTPLPAYVSTRLDDPPYAVARNQVHLLFSTLLTNGSGFGTADIDGANIPLLAPGDLTTGVAQGFQTSINKGHPTLSTFLELAPGQTRTISMIIGEPASSARPVLPVQALAQTPVVTFTPSSCAP